jgi:hypothetical protein
MVFGFSVILSFASFPSCAWERVNAKLSLALMVAPKCNLGTRCKILPFSPFPLLPPLLFPHFLIALAQIGPLHFRVVAQIRRGAVQDDAPGLQHVAPVGHL